jgi:hypothetical protein
MQGGALTLRDRLWVVCGDWSWAAGKKAPAARCAGVERACRCPRRSWAWFRSPAHGVSPATGRPEGRGRQTQTLRRGAVSVARQDSGWRTESKGYAATSLEAEVSRAKAAR